VPKALADATETMPSFGPSISSSAVCKRWSGHATSLVEGLPATLKQGTSVGAGVAALNS